MSRLIMQQALDALEMHVLGFDGVRKMELAIEALEAELAKPDETETLKKCLFQMQNAAIELAKPEPKLTDAGAETNIDPFTLYPKGSGMVTMNQVGMRVDLKDTPPRKEWIGLSINEGRDFFESKLTRAELIAEINEFLEEKNNAV